MATSQSASSEDMFQPSDLCDDLLCCVICYERFSDKRVPKALPCLHAFCRECLQGSMDSYRTLTAAQPGFRGSKAKKKNEFPCPVCKEVIKIPDNGMRGFKDDFRIRRISEMLSKRHSDTEELSEATSDSEGESDPSKIDMNESLIHDKCSVCSYFKKSSSASVYCVECMKQLCEGCSKKHLQASITSDHTVIRAGYGLPCDTTCRIHPGEPQLYYCTECKSPLCMTCTLGDSHTDHEMKKLKEVMGGTASIIDHLLQEVGEKMEVTEGRLQQLSELEKKLNDQEKTASRSILVKTIDEIMRIKTKMNKMEKELQTMCQSKHQKLQESRIRVQDQIKEMKEISQVIEKVAKHGQDLQILHIQNHLCPKLEKIADDSVSLRDVIEEKGLSDFGKFDGLVADPELSRRASHENPSKSSILAEIRGVVSQMRQISTAHSVDNHYPQLTKVIGRKGSGDGEFIFPSGVTCLMDGDVAIADMHNNRVQIFSRDGSFKSKFGRDPLKPCGLACTKDGGVVVTDCDPTDTSVKIFSPTGELRSSFGSGVLQYPFSVQLDSRGRYVVCDPAVNKIVILGHDGSLSRRFATKTKFAFYIAVNSRDEILMSDWVNHCIRVFDQGGAMLRKIASRGYDDGQVMIPLGLCTDRLDNIFVVDCKCSRVSVFNVAGRFLRHAIGPEEGISRSRAIGISRDGTLAITSGDNRRDLPSDVKFYQM